MQHFITDFILKHGYEAVFVLMVLESACIPIPSEVTMLFGGALANATFVATVAASHQHLNFLVVGLLGSAIQMVLTVGLSVVSIRRGYDLDAVSTPLVTASGEGHTIGQ